MIWKEIGVCKGSYICFFNTSDIYKKYFYYMVSCGYFQCTKDYRVVDKGTRPPLFFYLMSGSLNIEYEGSEYTANANDIILLNCFRPQLYYCTDNAEFLFFHYDGKDASSLTDYLINQNSGPVFTLNNAKDIYLNINEPIMHLCYQDQVSEATLSSMVYSTLTKIQERNSITTTTINSSQDISAEVIRYINNNIHKQITVQELANHVNLSPYYFSRLFKKEIGHSPLDYVSLTKINYAKMMLRTTTLSISEIAESLGYSSSASFINAFKLRRGISPKKYRNEIFSNMKETTAAHAD